MLVARVLLLERVRTVEDGRESAFLPGEPVVEPGAEAASSRVVGMDERSVDVLGFSEAERV